MATLRANGDTVAELVYYGNVQSDGAEADAMTRRNRYTYRAMSSGVMLRKVDSWLNWGTGQGEMYYPGNWKRSGKVKAEIRGNVAEIRNRMQSWADDLRNRGLDAEIS